MKPERLTGLERFDALLALGGIALWMAGFALLVVVARVAETAGWWFALACCWVPGWAAMAASGPAVVAAGLALVVAFAVVKVGR